MSAVELLGRLRELGVRVWAEGDKLRYRGPEAALTPDLLREMAAQKADLLDQLRRVAAGPSLPPVEPAPRTGDLPLSYAQQRLWFFSRLAPDSALYNEPAAFRMTGTVRPAVLSRALAEIVHRHEILRTTFHAGPQGPVQVVHPAATETLPRVDLDTIPPALRQGEALRLAGGESRRPFDLERGPLLRPVVLRLDEREHLLLLTMHHLVNDGWSFRVLAGELRALYEAFAESQPSPLAELPVQYADFAVWQRRWLAGAALAGELAWWRERLAGSPAVLALPVDRPRPPSPSYRGGLLTRELPPALAADLPALGRRLGATPYQVLLAAYLALLARHTGQDDVCVGSPAANRRRPEIAGLIGFFVNTQVLRADLSGDPAFREIVARAREAALDAQTHQDLPFERLVEELQPERAPGVNPLFQAMLAFQEDPTQALTLPGLVIELVELDNGTAKFDLGLSLVTTDRGLAAALEYSADLFDRTTAMRLLARFERLLAGAAADPDLRLSQLPLLTAAERHQVSTAWNDTASAYPVATIHELFSREAARRPDTPAVVQGDEVLTYRELHRRASGLALRLRELGAAPDVLVGLCVERSVDMVVGLLGILQAGGAYLPLDPEDPPERLGLLLRDAGAPVAVTRSGLRNRLKPFGLSMVCLDEPLPDPADLSDSGAGPDHLAYVLYTSGSTGVPKGVAVRHRSVIRLVRETGYARMEAGDVFLQLAPVAFDASTFEIWGCLLNGGTLALYPGRTPSLEGLADCLARHRVDTLWLTAGLFHLVVDERRSALAGLRQLLAGGEALSVPHVQRFLTAAPGVRLINGYGPTENTTFTCCHPIGEGIGISVPIGRPIANTRVYVADRELAAVPIGVTGELLVAGDGLARDYRGRPAQTAESFVPDPWSPEPGGRLYRTGDLVRLLADGRIEFLGRLDRQVKIRGFRVEPGEVEAQLAAHPALREAVVVVRDDLPGGRALVAYAVSRPEAAVATEELLAWLRGRLPAHTIPSALVLLDALPLTRNGKVDRAALPAPATVAHRPAAGSMPRTPVEEVIAGLFTHLLEVTEVGNGESFFALGGHSLLATRLASRLTGAFGVDLPLRRVFEEPTVAGLAREIDAALKSGRHALPPVVALPRPEDGYAASLSSAQSRLWFLDHLEPESPAYNVPAALRLRGDLRQAALRASLAEVVRRHHALRTVFPARRGVPTQKVAPPRETALSQVDLSALPHREAEARRLTALEARRPFDLARGPLLRIALIRLAAAEHVLLAVLHHIVADGWSLGLFFRELAELYTAAVRGRSAALPELPVQYADYAAWQRHWLESAAAREQLAWWRERLLGAPAVLELPTDRPRPAVASTAGATRSLRLPPEAAARARDTAHRHGGTLYMALLAGLGALLSRLSGSEDLAVGSPVANRNRPEVEGLIGFFANTQVLRLDLTGDPTFRELLVRVRDTALGAYTHQDLPFEVLVDDLQPRRDLAYAPLFQVLLVLEDVALPDLLPAGLEPELFPAGEGTAKFDLTWAVGDGGSGLAIAVRYRTDLFDTATAERWLGSFTRLLVSAAERPDERVSEIEVLSPAERQALLHEWNDTWAERTRQRSLPRLLEEQAALRPDAEAVVFGSERLSFAELDRRANQVARRLLREGVGAESRVGLGLDRSVEAIVGLWGILKAGGAYVPLDLDQPAARLSSVLKESGARVVVSPVRRLHLSGAQVVHLRDDGQESGEPPGVEVSPDQLAYCLYTSGSTGRPKGVMIRHGAVANLAAALERAIYEGEAAGPRVGLNASLAFDASVKQWVQGAQGRAVCLLPEEARRDGAEMLAWIRAYGLDALDVTPSQLRLILAAGVNGAAPRRMLVGGEGIEPALWQRLAAEPALLFNVYGPTECTVDAAVARIEGDRPVLGRPIENVRIYVLDVRQRPALLGVPGELCIGGTGVARGYLGRPDLTAERFLPDPWGEPGSRLYRTGDLARLLPDGRLVFLGRIDHQVKIRGYRIEPGEIESALTALPGVRESAVVDHEIAAGARRLVAFVVPGEGAALAPETLRESLRATLPEYMVPAVFLLLDALPLTPNRKVDRAALSARADVGQEPVAAATASPVTAAERTLAAIWSQLLRREVGLHDNFFELGGDSILSIQVVARAAEAGLRIATRQVFQHQTVAELAGVAESQGGATEQGPVTGPVPLTPIQRRFFETAPAEPSHYNQSVLLEVATGVPAAWLEHLVALWLEHHDALRLRFAREAFGWRQLNEAPGGAAPFVHVDLSALPEARRASASETASAAIQASLNLSRGPLLRAGWLDSGGGRPARLLVAIHHLAVDGVSWRVLLDDLARGLECLGRGEPVRLPAKTASFRRWAERLEDLAQATELPFWLDQARAEVPPLPRDFEGGENTRGAARAVTVALEPAGTAVLLAPRAYGLRVDEILLTALARALALWTGERRLHVALEGHGREGLADDLDLSRTVGWFTAVYPLLLELPKGGIGTELKAAREALRSVPGHGTGYGLLRYGSRPDAAERLRSLPEPEVAFNYLGRLDSLLPAGGPLRRVAEPAGPEHDPRSPRRYLLEINGGIVDEGLRLDWIYAPACHRRGTIERLADAFLAELREIVGHCAEADVEDLYPLTPVQHGLLFHAVATPGSYLTQLELTFRGPLDLAAFHGAWQRVLDRHTVLRTAFQWEGLPEPHQVIRRQAPLSWEEIDWQDRDDAERAWRELLVTDRERGIDLGVAPLMRLTVIRLPGGLRRLLWTHHHLLLDGWSVPILLREVFDAYRAQLDGREPDFERRRPYRDYVEWLGAAKPDALEARWRERLSGFRSATPLPGAGTALPRAVPGVEERSLRLDPDKAAAAAAFARSHQLTLNTLLLGAWALLLGRSAGEEDVVFGTTLSGRSAPLPGIESMVGLFINTLPLRAQVPAEALVLPWLRELQDRQVELQQLESSPLVDVQGWSDVPRSRPLFESLFVFENYPVEPDIRDRLTAGTGLELVQVGTVERTSYPLTLICSLEPDGALLVRALCDRHSFAGVEIERLLARLHTVLVEIATDSRRALGDVPLMPEAETRQVVAGGHGAAADIPAQPVYRQFETHAAARPDAPAVSWEDGSLSYGELANLSGRLATRLRDMGAGPETLLAVRMERSPELVVAALAALRAGAAYLPVDPTDPAERLAFKLRDSGARWLLTTSRLTLPDLPAPVLPVDLDELAGEAGPPPPLAGEIDGASLAYVIYTSGSTGVPKGTELSHTGLSNLAAWHRRRYGITPEDRATLVASPGFDASVWEIWPYLSTGAALCIPPPRTAAAPAELLAWMAEQRITCSFLPTPLAEAVLAQPLPPGLTVRALLTGGDRLHGRPSLTASFALINHYGPTEGTVVATAGIVEPRGERPPDIGRPIANARIHLLDRRQQPVPPGSAGELCVGGAGLARGYRGRPELTAERFVPDPFGAEPGARLYRTGDLARWPPGGALEFLGRADHQVKIRGYRIELGEIEAVLRRHPGVREAAVVVRENGAERQLVAYVVAAGEPGPDAAELQAALRVRLPEPMVPARFVALPALPLNASGKVDRSALPAPDIRPESAADAAVPAGDLEQAIAGIWREVLKLGRVERNDNFFDLGGHSLLLIQVHDRLGRLLGRNLPILDLFEHTTVAALAAHLEGRSAMKAMPAGATVATSRQGIAIVGMAGRFPGAGEVEELWRNLCGGVESISFFTDDEVAAEGIDPELLRQPGYVKARGVLDRAEWFDAGFFGISPREAEHMDPQHRVFLECAWEALEDAGWLPEACGGRIGVFAGASVSSYWATRAADGADRLLSTLGNDKDYVATRISYRLNLRGPSLTVQTACSTSLVAVHLACRSLQDGECDLALAGGVSIQFPQRAGYLWVEGGTRSPDGRCRAFDADAQGTVGGDGAAMVVLKRLEDALADGDSIRAVIRGTAINNDGSAKIGFTAPSVEGQAAVIAEALSRAGVAPDSIGFVETHGTGTSLGDPIEVAALTRAFRSGTEKTGLCALGALKTGIGHLDAAAGVTGLIKAALVLERGQIPPTLHYRRPNPEIDFAGSPFHVNAELSEWKPGPAPRRAGVSSFGIGGTNAHAVLEEAPPPAPSFAMRPAQLLVLSARSELALRAASSRLAEHLRGRPDADLADLAYTLQVGRRAFAHRCAVPCRNASEALDALEGRSLLKGVSSEGKRPVAFLFPGQGSQRVGMGRELYRIEPAFRRELDGCLERLAPHLEIDLRGLLFPEAGREAEAASRLDRTEVAQPALFAIEYALARLWMEWGVEPAAMLGHSLGEYVAACLAGVFTLDAALALVAARGRLMQSVPEGDMLSVPLPAREIEPLPEGLSLAAVNGPSLCVVSGPAEEIEAFAFGLSEKGLDCRRLRTSHAFHSSMTEPILEAFEREAAAARPAAPRLPFLSNLTGTWITDEQATDPSYWTTHLRRTVRFDDGLRELFRDPGRVLIEVGPGRALASLAGRHPHRPGELVVTASLGRDGDPEVESLLNALGRAWTAGVPVDWLAFHAHERLRRVPLPAYPFERRRYWIEPARPGRKLAGAAAADTAEVPFEPAPSERPARAVHPRPAPLGEPVPPRTMAERALAELWEELLGVEPIGVEDNYFALGGDSVLGIQLVARARERGIGITSRHLFEHPTIAALAATAGAEALRERSDRPGLDRPNPGALPASVTAAGEVEDLYPLSPLQAGILFHGILSPESRVYIHPVHCTLTGELDMAAFERAWQEVVDRHPVLRTAFVWDAQEPLQVVYRSVPASIERHDWSRVGRGEREERIGAFIEADRRRGFDLSAAPLLRLSLAGLGEGEHHCVWLVHHIVLDGWSVPLVLDEMFTLYESFREGGSAELPRRRPYRDYLDWLAGRDRAADEAFWRAELAGFRAPTPLPGEGSADPADNAGEESYQEESVVLAEAVTAGLDAFLRRSRLTLGTLLQSAWAVLLARAADSDDVLFGATVSGRAPELAGVEAMIGLFINAVPVRVRIEPDLSLVAWMGGLQAHQARLRQHEHSSLVQVQDWSEVPSRLPLFESIVVIENLPTAAGLRCRGGLEIRPGRATERSTSYPLSLTAKPGERLAIWITYDRRRIDPTAARRLIGLLEELLKVTAELPAAGASPRVSEVLAAAEARFGERQEAGVRRLRQQKLGRLRKRAAARPDRSAGEEPW